MNLSNIPYSKVFVCIKKTVHPKILGLGLTWNVGLEVGKLGFSSNLAEGHWANNLTSGLHFPLYVQHRGWDRLVAANLGCTLVSSGRLKADDALWPPPSEILIWSGAGHWNFKSYLLR